MRQRGFFSRTLAGAGVALSLAACASTPASSDELAVANSMLRQARSAGATQLAPVALAGAERKLEAAKAAARAEDHERAERLAEEAKADALLATTRARAARSRQTLSELRQGIAALERSARRER